MRTKGSRNKNHVNENIPSCNYGIVGDEKYCRRCRKYDNLANFTKDKTGHFHHLRTLCKESRKKKVLWDDHLNPKTILDMQKWYNKNEQQIKAYSRNLGRFNIQKLTPSYVKSVLQDCGFSKEILEAYPELIKTKTEIIKTNRLCKTL